VDNIWILDSTAATQDTVRQREREKETASGLFDYFTMVEIVFAPKTQFRSGRPVDLYGARSTRGSQSQVTAGSRKNATMTMYNILSINLFRSLFYSPSPSLSKRLNASLNSAICSSVNWSAIVYLLCRVKLV
jgi:hypothetical protein